MLKHGKNLKKKLFLDNHFLYLKSIDYEEKRNSQKKFS